DALAIGELPDRRDRVLVAHVDGMVGAEFAANLQAILAGAGQDHRTGTERLGDGHAEKPDGAGPEYGDAFARHESPELRQSIHRRSRGDHEGRLRIGHVVGNGHKRIDVVDLVLAKAAIRGESVGAVALVVITIVEPGVDGGGGPSAAALLALAATGMDLDGNALADTEFVDARTECHHGPHIFVSWREVLVEWQPPFNERRWAGVDDFKIS